MVIDTSPGMGKLVSSGFTIYEFDIAQTALFSYQLTCPTDPNYTVSVALPSSPSSFTLDNGFSEQFSDDLAVSPGTLSLWVNGGTEVFDLQWWYSGSETNTGWQYSDPFSTIFTRGAGTVSSHSSTGNVVVNGSGQYLDFSGHFDYSIEQALAKTIGTRTVKASDTSFHPASQVGWEVGNDQGFLEAIFGNWAYSAGAGVTESIMLLGAPDPNWLSSYTRTVPGGDSFPTLGDFSITLTFNGQGFGDAMSNDGVTPAYAVIPDTCEVWVLGGLQNRLNDEMASDPNFAQYVGIGGYSGEASQPFASYSSFTLPFSSESAQFPQRVGNFSGGGTDLGIFPDTTTTGFDGGGGSF